MFKAISSKIHLVWADTVEYVRTQENDGAIYWECITSIIEHVLKLENGNWYRKNKDDDNFVLITTHIPLYEQEYQEVLLAQNPIEKRVREIVQQRTGGSGEVLRSLSSDFDFVQLIKQELLK